MLNMPGRSSTVKDEPDRTGASSSLLGATGGAVGTQGQGMSWDELLHYTHQLTGVHPWTDYTIDIVALPQYASGQAIHS